MANLVLPFDNSEGFYTARVTLQNAVFNFTLRWNLRMARWILDVLDANGTPLVVGLPILTQQMLTDRFRGRIPGLPAGRFIAIDGTGKQLDPDSVTFGHDVQLLYIEA